jgi:hypothetical protein
MGSLFEHFVGYLTYRIPLMGKIFRRTSSTSSRGYDVIKYRLSKLLLGVFYIGATSLDLNAKCDDS